MKLEERPLHELQINQMRPDELKKFIQMKKRVAKNLRSAANFSLTKAKQAEAEIKKRPKSKAYEPGLYWDNTAYSEYGRIIGSREELVIVDKEGFPWKYGDMSGKWLRFGKPFNNTAERIWQKLGDL